MFSEEKESDLKETSKYLISIVSLVINVACIIAILVMSNQNKSLKKEIKKVEEDKTSISLKYEEFQLQKDSDQGMKKGLKPFVSFIHIIGTFLKYLYFFNNYY